MKNMILVGGMALAALVSGSAMAAGDAAAGGEKAAQCASCHGQNGCSSVPMYPNLAGQHAEYIVSSLQAYKSGQRQGGNAAIMQGMAAGLSDQDMQDLAAYYASQSCK